MRHFCDKMSIQNFIFHTNVVCNPPIFSIKSLSTTTNRYFNRRLKEVTACTSVRYSQWESTNSSCISVNHSSPALGHHQKSVKQLGEWLGRGGDGMCELSEPRPRGIWGVSLKDLAVPMTGHVQGGWDTAWAAVCCWSFQFPQHSGHCFYIFLVFWEQLLGTLENFWEHF